jgi:hypothetical protein
MLGLAEVVKDLRSELYSAMAVAGGEPLRFELGEIELELSVAVSREAGGSGKVRFWVIDLGAEAKAGSNSIQTLRLKLLPIVDETGRAPQISGGAVPGEGTGASPDQRD